MNKYQFQITILFIQFIFVVSVSANPVDSLLRANNVTSEKAQVELLMNYCFENRHLTPGLALEAGLRAFEIAEKIGDTYSSGTSANMISVIYRSFGEYEKALSYNIKAIKISVAQKDTLTLAYARNNLAHIYRYKKIFDKAMIEATEAHSLFKYLKNKEGLAFSSISLGYINLDLGNYKKSIAFMEEAIELRRELGDSEGELVAKFALGDAYIKLPDYEKSLDIYKNILENFQLGKFRSISSANLLAAIGNVYYLKNDFTKSAQFYQTALFESEKLGNIKDQIIFTIRLIEISKNINDSVHEERHLASLINLIKDFREWVPLSEALKVIHKYYYEKGDFKRAFEYSRALNEANDSLTFQLKHESIESIAIIYDNLGNTPQGKENKTNYTNFLSYQWYHILFIVSLLLVIIALLIKIRKLKNSESK